APSLTPCTLYTGTPDTVRVLYDGVAALKAVNATTVRSVPAANTTSADSANSCVTAPGLRTRVPAGMVIACGSGVGVPVSWIFTPAARSMLTRTRISRWNFLSFSQVNAQPLLYGFTVGASGLRMDRLKPPKTSLIVC